MRGIRGLGRDTLWGLLGDFKGNSKVPRSVRDVENNVVAQGVQWRDREGGGPLQR